MSTDPYVWSIRDILLVVVIQLGMCLFLLAEIASAVNDYGTSFGSLAVLVGALTAGGALLVLGWGPEPGSDADAPSE